MRFSILLLSLALAGLLLTAGCCDKTNYLPMVQAGMAVLAVNYDPLVGKYLDDPANKTVQAALVSTDTALLLGGLIRDAYCASMKDAEQFKSQAELAKKAQARIGLP